MPGLKRYHPTQPPQQFVETRKYQLDKKVYVNLAMKQLVRTQWRWAAIPVALLVVALVLHVTGVFAHWWIHLFAPLVVVGYLLFWLVQFTGFTQVEQGKPLFQKFSYEFTNQHIILVPSEQPKAKGGQKEMMQMKWESVQSAAKEKDHFVMVLSRAQFIYLPFSVFASEADIKFLESLMRRKNLLEAAKT